LSEQELTLPKKAAHIADPETRMKLTYEDLCNVPDDMTGEIIDGELSLTPMPSKQQIHTGTKLANAVVAAYHFGTKGPGGWIILDEPDLAFGEDILVPELAGWKEDRFIVSWEHHWISVAPDWVCEIISPETAQRDRTQKMPIYERNGVSYVWLIDPAEKSLEIFRLESGKWGAPTLYTGNDKVRAEPFEQTEINLGDLWLKDA
jgi:Uma2 family endonuclease